MGLLVPTANQHDAVAGVELAIAETTRLLGASLLEAVTDTETGEVTGWSIHRGGIHSGSPSALMRQVQPFCRKWVWWYRQSRGCRTNLRHEVGAVCALGGATGRPGRHLRLGEPAGASACCVMRRSGATRCSRQGVRGGRICDSQGWL